VILDDCYPNILSGFRIAEFNYYLEHYSRSEVHSTGSVPWPGKAENFNDLMLIYSEIYPHLVSRIKLYHPRRRLSPSGFYCIFLNNAYDYLPVIEKYRKPFILTLYPGGGFQLDDKTSDRKLTKVLKNKYLRFVIVTQKITHDYILFNNFCSMEKIKYIYGGVFSQRYFEPDLVCEHPFDRGVNICFVAAKYTVAGRDKGYDLFIEVAKSIAKIYPKVRFHVVGGFGVEDLDVTVLGDKITFYGFQTVDFFPEFYKKMHAIISPNRAHLLAPGAFDGFPTGCSVEAGLCGVGVFCTDPLGLNTAFEDGKDIVIIPSNVKGIVDLLSQYLDDENMLSELGKAAQFAFREEFSMKNQMVSRVGLLDKLVSGDCS